MNAAAAPGIRGRRRCSVVVGRSARARPAPSPDRPFRGRKVASLPRPGFSLAGSIRPDVASDRAIDLAHDPYPVLAQAVPTASSGGWGAGAGFRSDPPDDVVCDPSRRGRGSRTRRRLKGASPKEFRYSSRPGAPRRNAGLFSRTQPPPSVRLRASRPGNRDQPRPDRGTQSIEVRGAGVFPSPVTGRGEREAVFADHHARGEGASGAHGMASSRSGSPPQPASAAGIRA